MAMNEHLGELPFGTPHPEPCIAILQMHPRIHVPRSLGAVDDIPRWDQALVAANHVGTDGIETVSSLFERVWDEIARFEDPFVQPGGNEFIDWLLVERRCTAFNQNRDVAAQLPCLLEVASEGAVGVPAADKLLLDEGVEGSQGKEAERGIKAVVEEIDPLPRRRVARGANPKLVGQGQSQRGVEEV